MSKPQARAMRAFEGDQSSRTAPRPFASIADASQHIHAGSLSPVELAKACLERIKRRNPTVNAFITLLEADALRRAQSAGAEIHSGRWRGPLHGVPIGIKDMFDTTGVRTTAASGRLKDRVPARNAVAVDKLIEAGAIVVGKTNMHQLAMGTTSAVSDFGPVRNPWNPDFIAGGSSGGSAAAVASGMAFATLDTDAIGSCRLPASCCGVTGFKGTPGLISNIGILEGEPVDGAILWLAQASITTRTAEDAALALDAMAAGSPGAIPFHVALSQGATPSIGVAANASVSEEVSAAFGEAVRTLGQLGALSDAKAPFDCPGFDVRNIEADRASIARSLFSDVDVIVLPTTTAPVPRLDDAVSNPLALSPRNTMFANYYGLPAVSVPCGFDSNGLPLGLQIIGKAGDDATVLRLAHRYQQASAWAITGANLPE
jgi:aspartyl-tRNA(Asn)/glutamyl-tRNA(Gln) amidotransferase subunit A